MTKIFCLIVLTFSLPVLSAHAEQPPYDQAVFSRAFDERNRAASLCLQNRYELKNARGLMDCVLKADRHFADAIKLRDRALFLTYASKVRRLAVDKDAGKITQIELQTRFAAVAEKYGHDVSREFEDYQAAHAKGLKPAK